MLVFREWPRPGECIERQPAQTTILRVWRVLEKHDLTPDTTGLANDVPANQRPGNEKRHRG